MNESSAELTEGKFMTNEDVISFYSIASPEVRIFCEHLVESGSTLHVVRLADGTPRSFSYVSAPANC